MLLDQNLSPKLIRSLSGRLDLESVYDHHITAASDPVIFEWARNNGFDAVISTDRDFVQLVERLGQPPKVIESSDAIFRRELSNNSFAASLFEFSTSSDRSVQCWH